ncbi:MAG: class I SAM-dependent methyltransferase [Chloroflexota bacterium]
MSRRPDDQRQQRKTNARPDGRPTGRRTGNATPPQTAAPARRGGRERGETHWGNVADWYDQLVGDRGSEYHQHVIIPGVLRLLGLTGTAGAERAPRLRLLDLACGQGVLCRRLAEAGCDVTGVDASPELLAAARRRNEHDRLPLDYVLADATKLVDEGGQLQSGLAPAAYDAVTIILSIQNITPLSPVWQGARALLKPGGSLIIVMMHPCFRVPKQSDWHWDDRSATQSRLVSRYLSSDKIAILTHPGDAAHGVDETFTTHFHRPLQAYINTLGNAGLLIDHIEEWTSHKTDQAGPKKEAIDRARKEIPLFLALRARKV